jgi:hypothetical protein
MKRALPFLCAIALGACTVHQQTAVAPALRTSQPSFEGNDQNSGVISVDEHGFKVVKHFIDRYDAMLASNAALPDNDAYKLSSAPAAGDRNGITAEGEFYRITGEVTARFNRLNYLRNKRAARALRP